MHDILQRKLTLWKSDGRLTLIANLITDLVIVGWAMFLGLYAVEVLLPTFIMARLSLVKLALILLLMTSLLMWLGKTLEIKAAAPANTQDWWNSRWFTSFLLLVAFGIITLAHYRFPWWSIPLLLFGYTAALWLFWKLAQVTKSEITSNSL